MYFGFIHVTTRLRGHKQMLIFFPLNTVDSQQQTGSSNPTGPIVGAVVGVIALVAIVGVIVFIVLR
jgi:hypothetical protein